jgi:4-oxalocrotonate tautomerase
MPFITIKVKGPALTSGQISRFQKGGTDLLAGVLGKAHERIAVMIDQDGGSDWSIGADPVPFAAHLEATINTGANSPKDKAAFIAAGHALLVEVLGPELSEFTYVVIREFPGDAWGFGGISNAQRIEYAAGAATSGH